LRSTSRHNLGLVIAGDEDVLDVAGDSGLELQEWWHLYPIVVFYHHAWLWGVNRAIGVVEDAAV
jgi:hypothetical protein